MSNYSFLSYELLPDFLLLSGPIFREEVIIYKANDTWNIQDFYFDEKLKSEIMEAAQVDNLKNNN
jgi:hypothetical protein